MGSNRIRHPDFPYYLRLSNTSLVRLFEDFRSFIPEFCPKSNELTSRAA